MLGKKINMAASPAAKAQRAVFNASGAGRANFFGSQELLSDMEEGKVALKDIEDEELPAALRKMTPKERETHVRKTNEKRKKLQDKLAKVAEKRRAYIEAELKKDNVKTKDALGQKIYDAVRSQAAEKSIHYEEESAMY